MQSSNKRSLRRMAQSAILAGIIAATGFASVHAAEIGNQVAAPAVDQIEAQARADWRQTMAHSATPSEGCFQAEYPSILWKQVGCSPAAVRAHPVPPVSRLRNPFGHSATAAFQVGGGAQDVGNGQDFALVSSSLISSTTGSFPSVSGVTSEQGVGVAAFGGDGILGPNEYTLQLNTNADSSTSVCAGHANCTVWQQFLYGTDLLGQGQGAVFIQYWLLDFGSGACPAGFMSDGDVSCFRNSAAMAAPDVPVSQLGNLKLAGTASSGGNDTVTFTNGTKAFSVTARDSVLKIAQVWRQSEFNVVGNAGGSQAQFNRGSSVTVKVAATNGTTTAPRCVANDGTTGESNNLNAGACSTAGGSTPSIQFTESN